jgi:hypothetical protein
MPQGTSEWFAVRMGIPTASEFDTVCVTKGRGPGGISLTRQKYMRQLAAEIITGVPMENYQNGDMQRGKEHEEADIARYAFATGVEVQKIGFLRRGKMGCSPDGLVGNDGMVESKSKAPHLMIEILETQEIPGEHMKQLYGHLLVSQREWVDWLASWPGLPQFKQRVFRDERKIAEVKLAIDQFNEELAALVARIRSM